MIEFPHQAVYAAPPIFRYRGTSADPTRPGARSGRGQFSAICASDRHAAFKSVAYPESRRAEKESGVDWIMTRTGWVNLLPLAAIGALPLAVLAAKAFA